VRRRTGRGSGVGEEFGENWQAEKRSGGRGFVRVYEREVRVEEWGLFLFFFFIWSLMILCWEKKEEKIITGERERERENLILLKIVNFASMIFLKRSSLI